MRDSDLDKRIEALRDDFASAQGKPFEHFFCPILMRDEPAEMCKAHIINDALGTCGDWVPQRADVDNFYGSAVEADLITIIRNRRKGLTTVLQDPKMKGKIKPKLTDKGTPVEHYFPKPGAPNVKGHTQVKLIDNGESVCNLAIKKSADYLFSLGDADLSFVIDADFVPEVTASMIKAAHLTLFKMFGYRHVFSPTGIYYASILREFFEKHKPPAKCREAEVANHFSQFETMVVPILKAEHLNGTVTDNRLLSVFSSNGYIFAMGVIINVGADVFCVFVPGMEVGIDTYFSFLKQRPPSIAVKITQWVPEKDGESAHFDIGLGEPARLFFAAEQPRQVVDGGNPFDCLI